MLTADLTSQEIPFLSSYRFEPKFWTTCRPSLLRVNTSGTQAAATATLLESLDKSSSEHAPHDLDPSLAGRSALPGKSLPYPIGDAEEHLVGRLTIERRVWHHGVVLLHIELD